MIREGHLFVLRTPLLRFVEKLRDFGCPNDVTIVSTFYRYYKTKNENITFLT